MALEALGSNPRIYPTRLTISKATNINRLDQTITTYLTVVRLLVGYKSILINFFKLLKLSTFKQFKSLFFIRPNFNIQQYNLATVAKNKSIPPRIEKKLFDTVIKLNG